MPAPALPPNERWQVLVPVRAESGKTRLGFSEDPTEFFARDAIAAVRASNLVHSISVVGRELGADQVITDPGGGLNAAILAGFALLNRNRPVVVMLADLPSLRTADFDAVITAAHDLDCAFVPDHTGIGTTMALSRTPEFTPRFGSGSAQHFRSDGFKELDAPASTRLDVDTSDDLQRALRLGVGPATAAWWKRNGAASYVYCRLR